MIGSHLQKGRSSATRPCFFFPPSLPVTSPSPRHPACAPLLPPFLALLPGGHGRESCGWCISLEWSEKRACPAKKEGGRKGGKGGGEGGINERDFFYFFKRKIHERRRRGREGGKGGREASHTHTCAFKAFSTKSIWWKLKRPSPKFCP